ncbi:hypothetical protein [Micromonospora sp. HK10]|nr:hypothetical protein [Micromonospora sp. HK10]
MAEGRAPVALDGVTRVSTGPGLGVGVDVDESVVRELAVDVLAR